MSAQREVDRQQERVTGLATALTHAGPTVDRRTP